jgi:hypothetical protein
MISFDEETQTATNSETGNSVRFVERDPLPKDGAGDICEFNAGGEVFPFRLPADRGDGALRKQYPEDRNWSQQRKVEHINSIWCEANKLALSTFIISEFPKHDQPLDPALVEDFLRLVQAMERGIRTTLRAHLVEFREFAGPYPHVRRRYELDDAGSFTVS